MNCASKLTLIWFLIENCASKLILNWKAGKRLKNLHSYHSNNNHCYFNSPFPQSFPVECTFYIYSVIDGNDVLLSCSKHWISKYQWMLLFLTMSVSPLQWSHCEAGYSFQKPHSHPHFRFPMLKMPHAVGAVVLLGLQIRDFLQSCFQIKKGKSISWSSRKGGGRWARQQRI